MNAPTPHVDVAAYALGSLGDDERARFEAHLDTCDACRRELQELMPAVSLLALGETELPDVPRGLEARTLLAVERAAGETGPTRRGRRALVTRRRLVPALAAACVGIAIGVALALSGDDNDREPPVEAVAELRRGDRVASVALVKTGIGRVVEIRSDDLPILPQGEYYEVWFVGAGDRPGRPNRISAGTFHPDEQGRSRVTFAAAVDPRKYRRMAVTAEPGDGDPAPARRDVLTGRIELR
jgi:anti-sigma-K factor RskA